jgi:hypothetical protein
MEWRRRKFGTLIRYGEGFEPRGFGASKRLREGKKQATGDPHPRTVPLFKRGRACASGSVAHLTHDVLETTPFITCHIDDQDCNHRGCHKRSGDQSQRDVTLRHADKWCLGPSPEGSSPEEPDAGWRP